MKLNDFSKGLSTRIDPILIGLNEAVVYSNIDNTSMLLKSAKDYTTTTSLISKWFYSFSSVWYSSTLERDYVEYTDKLYYTEEGTVPSKIVNGNTKLVGIARPPAPLTAVDGGAGSISTSAETLQYAYTYYDSTEGVESEPSEFTPDLLLGANKQVDLTGFIPPINPSVDLIRLYRIGATATVFTLLVELPITTTAYTDNIQTINAIGYILDTVGKQAPLSGLHYLKEAYGMLFASIGSNIMYTNIGEPDVWPTLNTIDVYGTITGILPIQEGILIWTNRKMFLLVGSTPAKFAIVDVSSEYGCNSNKSCRVVSQIPVWSSNDGICSYQGGIISVISKDKLGTQSYNIVNTILYDEQYYILLTDGSLLVLDMRFGIVFKKFTFANKIIDNIGVFNNVLYAVIDGYVTTLFDGTDIELSYTSPEITEGDASVFKMYNNVYVRGDGDFIFSVLIDQVEVLSKRLEGNKIFDIKIPQAKQRGSSIQFIIYGKGAIKEIEYKVIGRQNGR